MQVTKYHRYQLDGHKNSHSSAMTACLLLQCTIVWLILASPRGGIEVKVTVIVQSPLQDDRLTGMTQSNKTIIECVVNWT